jgi:hypothetical protein
MEAGIGCWVKDFPRFESFDEFAWRRWNVKANHGHAARDVSKDETAGTTGFILMVKDLPARDGYPHPSGTRPTWR